MKFNWYISQIILVFGLILYLIQFNWWKTQPAAPGQIHGLIFILTAVKLLYFVNGNEFVLTYWTKPPGGFNVVGDDHGTVGVDQWTMS